tara:strand:- start:19506 stop:19688 length:183 start_codon:yes stop_codon:yes gene_type:complete
MSFARSPSWQKTEAFPSEYWRKHRFMMRSPTRKWQRDGAGTAQKSVPDKYPARFLREMAR